jgi:ATP-dependent exoDNAse (exonuclease V) alpha subunit
LTVGDVRDLYVAASRARSHLIVVSSRPLAQLQAAARATLALATDEP